MKIIRAPVYAGLARVLKDTLSRLDAVLDRPAYNLMIHTSPIGEEINDTITGTSRSCRNSPRSLDSSGEQASTSVPRLPRNPRVSCATPALWLRRRADPDSAETPAAD